MANSNLSQAKKAKNDEFYTQLSDIENELRHYRKHFEGKTIFFVTVMIRSRAIFSNILH